MPDSLFHFLFPVISALAARVHIKHPIRNIIIAGILAIIIDLDHLSFLGPTRGLFHNLFVTLVLPALFVSYVFYTRKSYYVKGFAILVFIFVSSHTFLDLLFGGGVALFYPFTTAYYSLDFELAVTEGNIVSDAGLGLLLYFASVILPMLFLDELIEMSEKHHETIRKAFRQLTHPKKQFS